LAKAQSALDYKKRLVDRWSKLFDHALFQGHTVKMINCPADFSSDIGEAAGQGEPFVLLYSVSRDKVYVSLRSHTDSEVSVKQIAEQFGGGGHLHSSGFLLELQQLPSLLAGVL
jgi:oligoribonuclease NrnB/cAMP/cGMP phosphodiesterase (DHH superfamily)